MLSTERLHLRRWRSPDHEPFARLNADPQVMAHMPKLLTRGESDAMIARIEAHWEKHGFGLWAVEIPQRAALIGFVGISRPSFETHFTPCVEVGWRIAHEHWGHGYAYEAARAALRYGFETVKLDEIVSFTVSANVRSWRLMERLGMQRDPQGDFDHPLLPPGHPLQRHVLYRLTKPTS